MKFQLMFIGVVEKCYVFSEMGIGNGGEGLSSKRSWLVRCGLHHYNRCNCLSMSALKFCDAFHSMINAVSKMNAFSKTDHHQRYRIYVRVFIFGLVRATNTKNQQNHEYF